MRRVEDGTEILDRPTPAAERAASLADIERLNVWFGGHALTVRHLARLLRQTPAGRPVTVVDLGAGGGDLALRLARWGRQVGRSLSLVALDLDPETLRLARQRTAPSRGIGVVGADAAALPLGDASVDVVVSSLLLHHLDPGVAAAALAEMARVSRLGFVVNDLWRARLGLLAVWLATRLAGCHPISRHDGPLSVRRSYSPAEIRALATRARIRRLEVIRYPLLARVIAVAEH
jgi:SAM-dependent methyltransferase